MSGYNLSRVFFDWCFDHPDEVKPNHIALYFFAVEHCNRLGWKDKFGLPTEMAKSAIGIHSYTTYIKTLNDLVEWGFIKMIQKSKNQYSSNIIALPKFIKAHSKALDKAIVKHVLKHDSKQVQSTCESIVSIDKPLTKEPINQEPKTSYQLCVDFWLVEFHPDFEFTSTSGVKMKSIIKKIESSLKKTGKDSTPELVLDSFVIICRRLPEWFRNKDLDVIDSKYNEIIAEIKNGTSKIQKHRDAANDALEILGS